MGRGYWEDGRWDYMAGVGLRSPATQVAVTKDRRTALIGVAILLGL